MRSNSLTPDDIRAFINEISEATGVPICTKYFGFTQSKETISGLIYVGNFGTDILGTFQPFSTTRIDFKIDTDGNVFHWEHEYPFRGKPKIYKRIISDNYTEFLMKEIIIAMRSCAEWADDSKKYIYLDGAAHITSFLEENRKL